ncbi:UDP-2-acetamido-2,6-beta-L-arabino-hexul-4-ose reductase [Shewanella sp. YLB-07]|uniref:UDP-2-acetamido-2,6-beta-L-arabino-hexul-4-ose reductase n=1 Tax=Shewanella sp. YLB-07 TaxID=2601268 RepID=UPI00128CE127|nr:NAD-dependent epimerase/dehydratase family protein [Shewanella sp. YLB-07]MPY24858.1 SDR family oxidoreductase [Shewanella sp. YLB-07]
MNIVVTGANGFIGKNLLVTLSEIGFTSITTITLEDTKDDILAKVESADFIYHLAGINRPKHEDEFKSGNADLTALIVNHLIKLDKKTPLVLTSSIQAELDNPYGVSKAVAENILNSYRDVTGATIYIYRLPNVFGKWCKPNYNSAIATFCYNTINNLPITINNAEAELRLVYIDDVCKQFVRLLDDSIVDTNNCEISPVYKTTVGDVAELLSQFRESRSNLVTEKVGTDFVRALYSTYLSYLDPEQFAYSVTRHSDERGTFVEMLKTKDSGQFSFFTAHPGITRGGHYHHSKTEKFLVIKGKALFKFQNIITDERYELAINGEESKIVETAPGWSHDVTNIGDDELIVMLWANEIFDRNNPDTFAKPL